MPSTSESPGVSYGLKCDLLVLPDLRSQKYLPLCSFSCLPQPYTCFVHTSDSNPPFSSTTRSCLALCSAPFFRVFICSLFCSATLCVHHVPGTVGGSGVQQGPGLSGVPSRQEHLRRNRQHTLLCIPQNTGGAATWKAWPGSCQPLAGLPQSSSVTFWIKTNSSAYSYRSDSPGKRAAIFRGLMDSRCMWTSLTQQYFSLLPPLDLLCHQAPWMPCFVLSPVSCKFLFRPPSHHKDPFLPLLLQAVWRLVPREPLPCTQSHLPTLPRLPLYREPAEATGHPSELISQCH